MCIGKKAFHIPKPLHIKHLPTPFTKKFNHRSHVFFWYLHGSYLRKTLHAKLMSLSLCPFITEVSKVNMALLHFSSEP